jgi:hypothetical protein
MMAATMLASCSKDEDNQIPQVTAQELVGTWEFQNPTLAEVIVDGSDMELVSSCKEEVAKEIASGTPMISEVITFKSDRTCTATLKHTDGQIENFKGTYTVANSRLMASYSGVESTDHKYVLRGALEMKEAAIYLVLDKQTTIDCYNNILSKPDLSKDGIALFKGLLASFTTGISILRCPLKMVKK